MTSRLIKLCIILPCFAAVGQLGPIDWTKVESRVAWFNGYEQPGLYTLVVNGTPALRNQASAGLFSPTKFPSGDFSLEIIDSRDNKAIFKDQLAVPPTGDLLIITSGNSPETAAMRVIQSADFPTVENKKRISFVNARTDTDCEVEILLPDEKTQKFPIDGVFSAVFDSSDEAPNLRLVARDVSGKSRTENIAPSKLPPNGAVFVIHTDADYFEAISISMISAETFSLESADEVPVSIDQ